MNAEQQEVALQLEDGTQGQALRFVGEVLTLRCARPYPPGRPLSLIILASEPALSLSGRCIGSRRQDEDLYLVRVRLTNLRREDRQWLQAHLPATP